MMKNRANGLASRAFSAAFLGALAMVAGLGCSEAEVSSSPALVDPSKTSRQSGSTDDIYDATQQGINSMMTSTRVMQYKGKRVVLDKIVNKTGIAGYDENIIYNKFLSNLLNAAGDQFIFLNRESVSKERNLQLSGQVKTSGVEGAPAGADLVLDIELRQLPAASTQTIQYTFSLTNLAGEIIWTKPIEIKKKA